MPPRPGPEKEPVRILGIESSCDETAAAVVEDGRRVLSNVVSSQVPLHARYGGVVPEIASRAHLEQIVPVCEQALAEANARLEDMAALAVTRGPGLAGCLLVGVEFAKAVATARRLPLVAVHHVAAHLYSVNIGRTHDAWGESLTPTGSGTRDPETRNQPYVALAISGGHTSLAAVRGPLDIEVLGETLDDAVGEAYDKVAKLAGLGYPGGAAVDRLAAGGNPSRFALPRPMLAREGLEFSFSGLKTAFAREVQKLGGPEALATDERALADLCASFQAACVDVLIAKAERALRSTGLNRLAVTGGVACNRGLRDALARRLPGITVAVPELEYCTDNAAMIAGLACHHLAADRTSGPELNVKPGWGMGS